MGNFRGVDRWRSDRKHPGDRRRQSWRPNKPKPVTKTSDSADVWISESGVVNREENNGRNYTGWSQTISFFTIPYYEENVQDTRLKTLKTKLSGFYPFSMVAGLSLLFDNWLENEFKLSLF